MERLRVLMIEDSPEAADLNARELRRQGWDAEWRRVETREGLVSALEQEPPDVVLCDHDLPRFDAPGALAILRERCPTLPVLIVTGTLGDEAAAELIGLGAWDYVTKEHLVRLGPAVRRALERARAEAQVRRLMAAVEQSPAAVVVTDIEGTIEYVNPSVTELTGYPPAELLGKNPRIWKSDQMPPETHAELWATITAGRVWRGELCNRRRDGRLFWERASIAPLRDAAGRITQFVAIKIDITAQRWAEQALRESEARFRAVFEASPVGIAVTSEADLRFVSANPAYCRMMGYTEEELKARTVFDVLHADEVSLMRSSPRGRLNEDVDHRHVTKAGDVLWARVRVSCLVDAAGQRTHRVAVVQDVSEQRQAEAQVLRLNRLLSTLLDVNQAIARAEDQPSLLRDVCRVLTEREVVRMAWIGLLDEATGLVRPAAQAGARLDYLEGLVVRADESSEGQGPTGWALKNDATAVCLDVAADPRMEPWRERLLERGFRCSGAFPFRCGRTRGALSIYLAEPNSFGAQGTELFAELASRVGSAWEVLEDRDERRAAEDALRLQKETLQAIVDNIPAMIVFFDASQRTAFVNREFTRVLGWTAEEVQRVDLIAELYPDAQECARVQEFIAASAGRWADFRTRARDGRTIETTWANVRLSDGTGFGVGQDVTERKRLEEQFRQAQKMEAVGRLAGGIAHDFNNLLGVITGYAGMALRGLPAAHPARPRIEQVQKAAARAGTLTRQLLAFSRRQALEPRVVDLNALLQDLQAMLHRLIGEDVELVLRPGADLGAVRVDPGQMEQVVMNLAVNARDAMPRGGTLHLETANAQAEEIRSSAHWQIADGPYVRLQVSDTGEGMDAATRVRIFEPFFTTKPLGQGTGLGLATAYGIVKQSGGHVLVDSQPGHGATFRIYMPRVAEVPESPAPAVVPVSIRGDETILLVEDQEALREVVRDTLQELGYHVLPVEDAEAALARVRGYPGVIHLLLSDVVMPKLSGPELADRLHPIRPGMRVLFMSGYTSDVLGRQGVIQPGIHLLEKPFTSEALGRKVREVLAGERS